MNKLRSLREENKITQIELAKILNVTQSAVAKWENEESKPRADKLIKLAKIFNCSLDELLKDE